MQLIRAKSSYPHEVFGNEVTACLQKVNSAVILIGDKAILIDYVKENVIYLYSFNLGAICLKVAVTVRVIYQW